MDVQKYVDQKPQVPQKHYTMLQKVKLQLQRVLRKSKTPQEIYNFCNGLTTLARNEFMLNKDLYREQENSQLFVNNIKAKCIQEFKKDSYFDNVGYDDDWHRLLSASAVNSISPTDIQKIDADRLHKIDPTKYYAVDSISVMLDIPEHDQIELMKKMIPVDMTIIKNGMSDIEEGHTFYQLGDLIFKRWASGDSFCFDIITMIKETSHKNKDAFDGLHCRKLVGIAKPFPAIEETQKILSASDEALHLPPAVLAKIENHFSLYSRSKKEYDEAGYNSILLPIIHDIIDYIMKGSYNDIEEKRALRKKQFPEGENDYIIVEKELNSNVGNWKNLVQEICTILHNEDALGYIPVSQFFDIPVIDEKDFVESDTMYYKGISLNVLLTRQLVCEGYTYFDEYLDYITPTYNIAHDYAHGHRRFFQPFRDGYIICINKEKLHTHLASLKKENDYRQEEYFQINSDQKNELYLYHSIVPISCVESIIKVPPHKEN